MVRKLFLTPPDIPAETVCRGLVLPHSQEWLGVFSKALLATTNAYNYEQLNDTDLTAEQAAAEAYTRYVAWLAAECGGDCPAPTVETPDGPNPVYRRNPATDRWEIMQPDGTWVEPAGEEAIPEPTARSEGTPTDRICAAATNAANLVKEIYDDVLESINADVDASETAVVLAASAAVWAGAWVYPAALGAIFINFSAFIGFAEFGQNLLLSNLWNDHFTQRYICCLKANATDTAGVVTFDRFGVNECLLQAIWDDQQYAWLVAMVIYIQDVIGEQGLNLLGIDTTLAGNCSHCGEWARDFDFRLGPCGWGLYTAGDAGTWQAAGYWFSTTAAGPTLILTCNPPINSGFVITRIWVDYELNPLPSGFADEIRLGSHSPSRAVNLTNSPGRHTFDTGYTLTWTDQGDVAFRFFKSGTDGSRGKLHRIRYYGTGTQPFSDLQGVPWYGA